nr:aldo/keto reductase [Chelatococcus sambhunathii]
MTTPRWTGRATQGSTSSAPPNSIRSYSATRRPAQRPDRRPCRSAGEIGWSPSELALKFVAARPFVACVIIGATSRDQLEQDLAAFERPWSEDIEGRVDAIRLRSNPCP